MTDWSWRKWPDLLVDFGQQLYIPWQLSTGKHLYQDIALLHGPFSQYFNAFWFRIFGPSLTVLIFINLLILAAVTFCIYRLNRLYGDRLNATACAAVFLGLFGFSQYVGTGNYNWVCPYTHESVHGVALVAAAILLFSRFILKGKRLALYLSGTCLGLALLTKVDVAYAALATGFCALVVLLAAHRGERRSGIKSALIFTGMAAVPFVAFFLYFLSRFPANRALAAAGSGLTALSGDVAKNAFYQAVSGMDNPGANLIRMAIMSAVMLGFAAIASAVDIACRKTKLAPFVAAALASATFLFLVANPDLVPWLDLPRALPAATLLALIAFAAVFIRSRARNDLRILPMLLWTVLALALLPKMWLNAKIAHYGFYLAMPATLVAVACLVYWIPLALKTRFQSGVIFRWLSLAVIAAGVIFHLKLSDQFYEVKVQPIGKGGDQFYTYPVDLSPTTSVAGSTLQWIDENMRPDATFAALPEGIMFNYLSRRRTTLPQVNMMMTELLVFGENEIVEGMKAHPPDYVLLVQKNAAEFGVGPFGTDPANGKRIMQWVNRNYDVAALFGSEPFQTNEFGIKILKRSAAER